MGIKSAPRSRIVSADEIPVWLREADYRDQLSPADWYRAIRSRQLVLMLLRSAQGSAPDSRDQAHGPVMDIFRKIIDEQFVRDSPLFYIEGITNPVENLKIREVLFLNATIKDPFLQTFGSDFERFVRDWETINNEPNAENSGGPFLFLQHELRLAEFFKHFDDRPGSEQLGEPAFNDETQVGNPFLSYARPLNGHPITVDTQFDDETIVFHFKQWLSERRKSEKTAIRRSISQNDLDRWESYRIRQVLDLDIWASLTHCRITDQLTADLVWPTASDGFSPLDFLRTTGRKTARSVFTFEVAVRFYGQLQLELGENFLEK